MLLAFRAQRGNDKLIGDADATKYNGGAGNDSIRAKNGKIDRVDCGRDTAHVDKIDKVKGCEKVKRSRR